MRKVPLLLIATLLFSCSQPEQKEDFGADSTPINANALPVVDSSAQPQTMEAGYQVAGDSILLPAFSIQVKLSEKAEEKLRSTNETIMLSATYQGMPKDTTNRFFQQWGYIVVANGEVELTNSRIATFNQVKISKEAYEGLASKDVEVLVDVFSGRHASQNNILSCESLQQPISKARAQTTVLAGGLIGE